jgi:uncharacterized membrane protein
MRFIFPVLVFLWALGSGHDFFAVLVAVAVILMIASQFREAMSAQAEKAELRKLEERQAEKAKKARERRDESVIRRHTKRG